MALKELTEKPMPGVKKILGVMAGKGGVGKSTVSVNLARAYQKLGYQVGLLDADIYGPSIKLMLNLTSAPEARDGRVIPPESAEGIRAISLSLFKQGESHNAVRAPIANSIIAQFIHDVDWGELDLLIVDFPPGTGDIQLTLMQNLSFDGAILVSLPQLAAVIDVMKAREMARNMEIPVLGVVENMSYLGTPDNQVFGKSHVAELGEPILGRLPVDPLISTLMDVGASPFENPDAEMISKIFYSIAGQCEGESRENLTEIKRESAYTFELVFPDGECQQYKACDVQSMCPCARCRNRKRSVDDKVEIAGIRQVGRYAVQIDFSSGCSNGIYSYQFLKEKVYAAPV